MLNSQSNNLKTSETKVLDSINTMSSKANKAKEDITRIHSFLNESSYKIDAILNIINNLKTKEQNIAVSGGDPNVIQQISEEQIDSFLEMLKTPTFQNLIKQVLQKYVK